MIYFLQLGGLVPAALFNNPPKGLPGWTAPVMFNQDQLVAAASMKPELMTDAGPLLFTPFEPDLYSNARIYRQAHLGLLAGYAGIDELLFDAGGYGLLASTPDVVDLRPEHLQELTESLAAFRRQYPEAKCEYAGPNWPATEPEPPFENQVLDLLVWLVFWVDFCLWALPDRRPVLANMDYTKHPHYAQLEALKR